MIKTLGPVRALLFLFLLVGVQACATTSDQNLENRDMDVSRGPERILKILVLSDGTYDRGTIDQHIAKASRTFEHEFGLRMAPVRYAPISWNKKDTDGMLNKVYATANGCDFDLAIGYAGRTPGDLLVRNFLGGWDGAIDDTWRRYIVIKNLDDHTMLHELAHAFIFSELHSGTGLMAPIAFQLLPFTPALASNQFNKDLRSEILRNKWRDFSEVAKTAERPNPIVAVMPPKPVCG